MQIILYLTLSSEIVFEVQLHSFIYILAPTAFGLKTAELSS